MVFTSVPKPTMLYTFRYRTFTDFDMGGDLPIRHYYLNHNFCVSRIGSSHIIEKCAFLNSCKSYIHSTKCTFMMCQKVNYKMYLAKILEKLPLNL